ncbi:undecaprenyl-phosphate alpha-N-acetylglucosaminyl 1-phosphate transferase [Clostridia bacterium]|nr:undecaprenyl-phosphate alpha-N-acetylglucosaminyl 1-phosphate transferase [Clostridia bacterium]
MEEIIVTTLADIELSGLLNGILAFIFAALLAFVITPLVRVLAFRIGAVDVPKDNRRMHKVPIPRLGGLAIFIAFVAAVLIFYGATKESVALILGSAIIAGIGIVDDVFRIKAIYKLLAQLAAAGIIVWSGIIFSHINLFGDYISFGIFKYPITILWIVALTNAVNLIDGLDGLACGISAISAMSLLFVTLIIGDFGVALIIAILAGACIGFLPFNIYPAKMFGGDTAAMFLGFVLSVVSIMGVFKLHALLTFVMPFLIFSVPLFDTLFAIVRRIAAGRPPFSADRGHLHHRLIDMGFNQRQSVVILYAVSALFGVSAVLFVARRVLYGVILIAVSIIITLLMWQILRHEKTRAESGLMESPAEKPEGGGESESSGTFPATEETEGEKSEESGD